MTEARTVAVIGIAAGGAVLICILIFVYFLVMRYRYNKWLIRNPSEDPRHRGKMFACYAYCCVGEKEVEPTQNKTLNPQTSVSYKSDVVSMGEEVQEVVIKNAEGYKDSSFTNAAFAESRETDINAPLATNGVHHVHGNEAQSAGIAKDTQIIISHDDNDDDDAVCEIRKDSPIRRSAEAYSEIDLSRESGIDSPRIGRISTSQSPDESAKKGKFKMKFRSTKK